MSWTDEDVRHLGAKVGDSSWQSFYEMLTLGLALCLWAKDEQALAVLGDNTSSLQDALDLSGSGAMLAVARFGSTLHALRRMRRSDPTGAPSSF